MSCNPAIGGQGKGQIVREIDALGGEMALNTDFTAIQFKLLNTSKGRPFRHRGLQCDKKAYQMRMKHVLEQQENITIFQAMVNGLIVKESICLGVTTSLGINFYSKSVVVTTGTFLQASTHIGQSKGEGGRLGDHSAKGLSAHFIQNGIELKRFKTGTPPRLLGRSINFDGLETQEGDEIPTKFAFITAGLRMRCSTWNKMEKWIDRPGHQTGSNLVQCYLTYTNNETHSIINDNLHCSPLYKGDITGTGPRYCPSIEDKVMRLRPKNLIVFTLSQKVSIQMSGILMVFPPAYLLTSSKSIKHNSRIGKSCNYSASLCC